MAIFKVIAVREEYEVAYIEADSSEKAKKLASTSYDAYDWKQLDESSWHIYDLIEEL